LTNVIDITAPYFTAGLFLGRFILIIPV